MLDVPSTEGLGLARESTDLALILIRCAASAISGPAPTALCEARLVLVFMLALCVAAQLSEFEDSECSTLCGNQGTAAKHTLPFGLCMFSELNRWCAGRQRTDRPSRVGKKPGQRGPVRRPPRGGRPATMQRSCCLMSRPEQLPSATALR